MSSVAVLFGINYVGFGLDHGELRGCVNDVRNMARYLKEKARFDVVEQYTDEDDPAEVTGRAIVERLTDLARRTRSGEVDRVWVHYSGHGCGIRDRNGDEWDGQDECILPVDYRTKGVVTDDVLNRIVREFDGRAKVTMVFDCCHSGTIADLKYSYAGTSVMQNNFARTCAADVCLISGCTDDQTSADAFNVRGMGAFTGAMSSCLLDALASTAKTIECMRLVTRALKEKGFRQTARLSSSREVDLATTLI